jgi:predicted aconitase with swiveling domain
MMLRLLAKRGKKPAAIVNTRNLDANLVEGAILADIPMLCYPEKDPYDIISTGDRVEVDGETGMLVKMS